MPKVSTFLEAVQTYFSKQKSKVVIVKSKAIDLKWLADKFENEAIKPVIDQVFPLDEIQKAHERQETKRAKGKIILQVKVV